VKSRKDVLFWFIKLKFNTVDKGYMTKTKKVKIWQKWTSFFRLKKLNAGDTQE